MRACAYVSLQQQWFPYGIAVVNESIDVGLLGERAGEQDA